MADIQTLNDLAKKIAEIDICMLSTHTEGGNIASRPMSNNGEVDSDGDSYYFTWDESRMVTDIEGDPKVSLAFQAGKGFMVAIEGVAELVRDKARFQEHWTKELDQWFKDGIDTEGVVMIKVHATRAHYWDGEEGAELKV